MLRSNLNTVISDDLNCVVASSYARKKIITIGYLERLGATNHVPAGGTAIYTSSFPRLNDVKFAVNHESGLAFTQTRVDKGIGKH